MGRCCDCTSKNACFIIWGTIMMTLGWCCNIAAMAYCKFVQSEEGFVQLPGNNENRVIQYVGLYGFADRNDYCYYIDPNTFTNMQYWYDNNLVAARACGGLAGFFGFCILWWMWFGLCCGCHRNKCIRIMYALTGFTNCVLSGMMFLINRSYICNGHDCKMSTGGGLAIGAIVAYFFSSVLCCCAPDADDDDQGPPPAASKGGESTVTVEKTEMDDGTVIEKTTTTHPDGSVTVEEKKIEPVPEGPMDEEEAIEAMPKAQVE